VLEETGHQVSVHGFLGSMLYSVDGRIKIVQFWHMRVIGGPMREPMDDIKAVKWLPLKQAIEILTRAHEKVFLANVGRSRSRQRGKLRATSASSRIFTATVSGGDRACGLHRPNIDGCGGVLQPARTPVA
jgi:8-oxo-dGTP diphosphatase